MGSSSPLIFDISSSDEELGFGSFDKGVDWGVGECGGVDYFDWLFSEVGGKEKDNKIDSSKNDDSDDVVILSEVLPQKDKKFTVEGSNLPPVKDSMDDKCGGGGVDDDDDDDCVILDSDPNKPLLVVKDKVDDGGRGTCVDGGDDDDNDDDDVEIVSEKGEVACRDFPHPRHLCAKFSFESNSHEIYCGQCHCYVCDSLAPCSRWGTGINSFDHCHATDKDEYWKIERTNMKTGVKSAPPLPQFTSLPQTPGVRPAILRPCSVPSNDNIMSKIISQRTNNISRSAVLRYSPHTQLASPQLQQNACNTNAIPRNQSPSIGHRGASISTPRVTFKRPGVLGTSLTNRHAYGSHVSGNSSINGHHTHKRPMVHRVHDSNQLNVSSHATHSVLPQVRSSALHSSVPARPSLARPQITHRPYSSGLVRDPRQTAQSQTPSESFVRSNNCVNVGPFQPVAFRPSVDVNLQNANLSRPHMGNHLLSPASGQNSPSYQSNPGFMVSSSNFDLGNKLANQVHSHQMPSLLNAARDTEHQNQTQNSGYFCPSVVHANQKYSLGHDTLQVHVDVPQAETSAQADNSQSQSTAKDAHLQPQDVGLTGNSSPINNVNDCLIPESTLFDFELDSWMLENNKSSDVGSLEIPMSPVWNTFSSDPLDPGFLLDG